MLFTVSLWAGYGPKEKLKKAGFDIPPGCSGMDVDGDIGDAAKKIFDTGLNVMMYHSGTPTTPTSILFVDDRRFSQR